jgi:hypothetical protein
MAKDLKAYQKAWREAHKEEMKAYRKAYYLANKESVDAKNKLWSSENKEREKENARRYYLANKERLLKSFKQYREVNKETLREYSRIYVFNRRHRDIEFRLKLNVRRRLHHAVSGLSFSKRTREIIGCELSVLKSHLANNFLDGMSWENYGKWEIDHIIPCFLFDLKVEKELLNCFHYSNLQPMWKIDNIKKSNKLEINYG